MGWGVCERVQREVFGLRERNKQQTGDNYINSILVDLRLKKYYWGVKPEQDEMSRACSMCT
jgi:hypothetical protein